MADNKFGAGAAIALLAGVFIIGATFGALAVLAFR